MIWNLFSLIFGLLLSLLLAFAICVPTGLLIVSIISIFKGLKSGLENDNRSRILHGFFYFGRLFKWLREQVANLVSA